MLERHFLNLWSIGNQFTARKYPLFNVFLINIATYVGCLPLHFKKKNDTLATQKQK